LPLTTKNAGSTLINASSLKHIKMTTRTAPRMKIQRTNKVYKQHPSPGEGHQKARKRLISRRRTRKL
jgi:hypothetical protein